MSATAAAPSSTRLTPARRPHRGRQAWTAVVVVLLVWSAARAGLDLPAQVNERGWSQVRAFFAAMFSPALDGAFLRLSLREAGTTLAYALVGTVISLIIGLLGGVVLAERLWRPLATNTGRRPSLVWRALRVLFAVPRSVHEVVFGLILVNILGLDPLVAVLAIGVPFGAVTAKVFSELLDEAPDDAEQALRAAGAGRITALVFGVFPHAIGDLLSYGFYRFECAIRSAAVLGIVGAGGLGFQLALSFQSLRYDEMWTLLWALILISGVADRWSASVRRRRASTAVEMHGGIDGSAGVRPPPDRFVRASAIGLVLLVPVAWWWIDARVSSLWSSRNIRLAGRLWADAWPPEIGDGGLSGLVADSIDTIALAVLALGMAFAISSVVAFVARRPSAPRPTVSVRIAGTLARFVLLVARSVPPPVWAFMAVFVLFPGLWPGAVALGLYNLGVLGRLQAEVVEHVDKRAGDTLRAMGAGPAGVAVYATIPAVAGRFTALALYRWEVAIRETVIVGVVGAAGLGRRLSEQTSSFDYDGILSTILALAAVTVLVDFCSASIRRSLR